MARRVRCSVWFGASPTIRALRSPQNGRLATPCPGSGTGVLTQKGHLSGTRFIYLSIDLEIPSQNRGNYLPVEELIQSFTPQVACTASSSDREGVAPERACQVGRIGPTVVCGKGEYGPGRLGGDSECRVEVTRAVGGRLEKVASQGRGVGHADTYGVALEKAVPFDLKLARSLVGGTVDGRLV